MDDEIRFDRIHIDIEGEDEDEEENRDDGELCENDAPLTVFIREEETAQNKGQRYGDGDGKKSHECEDIRENTRSLHSA